MTQLNELHISQEHYEGPLDVLLRMLEVRELDITKVSLSIITGDFLVYVEEVGEHNPALLGEFLAVASRLLHLKSSLILPSAETEVTDEEDEESLEEQLKHYKAIKEAARLLAEAAERGQMLPRQTETKPVLTTFTPISEEEFQRLGKIFAEILAKETMQPSLPETKVEKEISLEEKVEQIQRLVRRSASLDLIQTLRRSRNHTEIVVSFLAILELLKQRVLRFDGVTLWRIEA